MLSLLVMSNPGLLVLFMIHTRSLPIFGMSPVVVEDLTKKVGQKKATKQSSYKAKRVVHVKREPRGEIALARAAGRVKKQASSVSLH